MRRFHKAGTQSLGDGQEPVSPPEKGEVWACLGQPLGPPVVPFYNSFFGGEFQLLK